METYPSRARTAFGLASGVVLGAGAAVAGVLMLAQGSGWWPATGAGLLATVLAACWALFGPRTPTASVRVTTHDGVAALELPLRRGHLAAVCTATLAFGLTAVLFGIAAVESGMDGPGRRRPEQLVLLGPPFAGLGVWMGWRALRGRGRVLLTHEALVLPALVRGTMVVPWRTLSAVRPGPVPSTSAVFLGRLHWRGGESTHQSLPVGRIAWRWQQTLAVVTWCDRERRARRVLREGSPEQVEELADIATEVAQQALRGGRGLSG